MRKTTTTLSTRPISLSLVFAFGLILAGCSGTNTPTPSASGDPEAVENVPSSPDAAGNAGICADINAQLEGLNFFPLTLAAATEPTPGTDQPGNAALKEVKGLEAEAPAGVKDDVTALREVMAAGVADPSAFNREEFIDAKIDVENWVLENC